jgi:hypothetical protein
MHGRPCIRFGSIVILARSSDMLSPRSIISDRMRAVMLFRATLLCAIQFRAQHLLYFFPEPQGHSAFRPTLVFETGIGVDAW